MPEEVLNISRSESGGGGCCVAIFVFGDILQGWTLYCTKVSPVVVFFQDSLPFFNRGFVAVAEYPEDCFVLVVPQINVGSSFE